MSFRQITKILTFIGCWILIPLCSINASPIGGGSDGGGNTYRGKPLESCAKDPTKLFAYQNLIEPLLKNILSKNETESRMDTLHNLLLSVFSQKVWYFVPGPLEHIPADLLNSAVRTDQAALQGFDRVWIDKDIWMTMNTEDQAKLLLHEAFMGLKILQFAGSYRLCQAAYRVDNICHGYDLRDGAIKLTSRDYTEVQKMTVQSASQYLTMSATDWKKMINQNSLKYYFRWFDEAVIITPLELSQLLFQSKISGFMPTRGYNLRALETGNHPPFKDPKDLYEHLQKHKESCEIDAEVSGQNLQLKLLSNTESFNATIPLPEKVETYFEDIFNEKRTIQRVGISYQSKRPRANGGFSFYNIWLGFNSIELTTVSIQEMVCADVHCNAPEVDAKGGTMYICSDNDQLLKP